MLKSWSIQNFKPILNSGELKLAPVTVLAGRNSSGKSSLIQSILMIAQTLSSRVLDRPLLSHGPFARLGTFADILNKYSGQSSLIVEFQLDVDDEAVKTEMAGQSGASWQIVHRDGQQPLPLSAVGVGISQILPILVMGLLAPSHTLLLVEQPELHLHPSVQARLGDFFLGLAKCNKQCLIETHSENLVNQLRYHIVQADGQDKSACLIYFVDQDERGAAKFEPIEISPQGNILNWPEGFFDETILQEGRINTESLRKRAKKAHNR